MKGLVVVCLLLGVFQVFCIDTCPSDKSCQFFQRLDQISESVSHWPTSCYETSVDDINTMIRDVYSGVLATCEGACLAPEFAPNRDCADPKECRHLASFSVRINQLLNVVDDLPASCVADRIQVKNDINDLAKVLPDTCQCPTSSVSGCSSLKVCTFTHALQQVVDDVQQFPLLCLQKQNALNDILKQISGGVQPICAGRCNEIKPIVSKDTCPDVEHCPALTDYFTRHRQLVASVNDLEDACFATDRAAVLNRIVDFNKNVMENCSSCPNDPLPANCDQSQLCEFHTRYNQLFDDLQEVGCPQVSNIITELQTAKSQVSVACPGSCNLRTFKAAIDPCLEARECPALVDLLVRTNQTISVLNQLPGSCVIGESAKARKGITDTVDKVEFELCDGSCASTNFTITPQSSSENDDDDDGFEFPLGLEIFIAIVIICLLLIVLCVVCVVIAVMVVTG